jgi:hypothetical protein
MPPEGTTRCRPGNAPLLREGCSLQLLKHFALTKVDEQDRVIASGLPPTQRDRLELLPARTRIPATKSKMIAL